MSVLSVRASGLYRMPSVTLGLRGCSPTRPRHPASLPICVPSVERLPPALSRRSLADRPGGSATVGVPSPRRDPFIIDHYRTRKKTSELTESLPAELSESEAEVKELKAVFCRLLYSLPEPYRDALVLIEFEGLTQGELAKHLGISLSGAKSRVQRGREQLKELLLDYCHREFSRSMGSQPCPKGLLPIVQDVKMGRKGTPPLGRTKSRK